MATTKPLLLLGALPKKQKDVVLDALTEAQRLLDSVVFVSSPGDTDKPLRLLRAAIKKVTSGK